jgi:lexA repressor
MRALTERQRQVLDFLHRHLQTHGLPPTLHELMHAFGWASPAGAAKHLQALAARGLIELSPGKARGIRLLQGAAPPPAGGGGGGAGGRPVSRSSPETASSVT